MQLGNTTMRVFLGGALILTVASGYTIEYIIKIKLDFLSLCWLATDAVALFTLLLLFLPEERAMWLQYALKILKLVAIVGAGYIAHFLFRDIQKLNTLPTDDGFLETHHFCSMKYVNAGVVSLISSFIFFMWTFIAFLLMDKK